MKCGNGCGGSSNSNVVDYSKIPDTTKWKVTIIFVNHEFLHKDVVPFDHDENS